MIGGTAAFAQPELWLIALIPIWLFVVAAASRVQWTTLGVVAFAILVHNMVGGFLPLHLSSDRQAEAAKVVSSQIEPGALLLTADSSGFARYLDYNTEAEVVHIGLDPDALRAVGSALETEKPATCFPTASAIASSWNPAYAHRGRGAGARGSSVQPVGHSRSGNQHEALAAMRSELRIPLPEDPYLAGELAVGMVDGIQSHGIGTSVKHYAANNQEDDRLRMDARVDERTLREIYLPAFERVVTASQPWTIMCAYNKVNGLSASENPWLLTQVLRDEWGFEGLVMSDWGAVYHRVPALQAGLDLEMPPKLGRSPRWQGKLLASEFQTSRQSLSTATGTILSRFRRRAIPRRSEPNRLLTPGGCHTAAAPGAETRSVHARILVKTNPQQRRIDAPSRGRRK